MTFFLLKIVKMIRGTIHVDEKIIISKSDFANKFSMEAKYKLIPNTNNSE